MRAARIFAILFLLAPCAVHAQEVQVRLFAAIAPKSIAVTSTQGDFHWRECSTCADHAERNLTIDFAPEKADGESPSSTAKAFFITGNYQIIPAGGPAFTAAFPVRIERKDSGFVVMVSMPMEQYVSAVLSAENGASKNDEALKAMAVAIRTYATRFHGQHEQDGFDFCDTTHCQTMKLSGVDSRNRAAVAATRGEILFYQDAPARNFLSCKLRRNYRRGIRSLGASQRTISGCAFRYFLSDPGRGEMGNHTYRRRKLTARWRFPDFRSPNIGAPSKSNRAPPVDVSGICNFSTELRRASRLPLRRFVLQWISAYRMEQNSQRPL